MTTARVIASAIAAVWTCGGCELNARRRRDAIDRMGRGGGVGVGFDELVRLGQERRERRIEHVDRRLRRTERRLRR
jgi:hypothetical protein